MRDRRSYNAEYRRAHRDELLAYGAAYRATHKDEAAANNRAYRESHGDQIAARRAEWLPSYYEKNADRLARQRSDGRAALKAEALNAYGGPKCSCCGETLIEALTIDHINGDGAKSRQRAGDKGAGLYRWLKNNKYPSGYQVLCMTCNFAKGTKDHCPHQDLWL